MSLDSARSRWSVRVPCRRCRHSQSRTARTGTPRSRGLMPFRVPDHDRACLEPPRRRLFQQRIRIRLATRTCPGRQTNGSLGDPKFVTGACQASILLGRTDWRQQRAEVPSRLVEAGRAGYERRYGAGIGKIVGEQSLHLLRIRDRPAAAKTRTTEPARASSVQRVDGQGARPSLPKQVIEGETKSSAVSTRCREIIEMLERASRSVKNAGADRD